MRLQSGYELLALQTPDQMLSLLHGQTRETRGGGSKPGFIEKINIFYIQGAELYTTFTLLKLVPKAGSLVIVSCIMFSISYPWKYFNGC